MQFSSKFDNFYINRVLNTVPIGSRSYLLSMWLLYYNCYNKECYWAQLLQLAVLLNWTATCQVLPSTLLLNFSVTPRLRPIFWVMNLFYWCCSALDPTSVRYIYVLSRILLHWYLYVLFTMLKSKPRWLVFFSLLSLWAAHKLAVTRDILLVLSS